MTDQPRTPPEKADRYDAVLAEGSTVPKILGYSFLVLFLLGCAKLLVASVI